MWASQCLADVTVKTRFMAWSADRKAYDTENDSRFGYRYLTFNLEETALVLLDVWDSAWNDGLGKRIDENVRTKLKPALDHARALGMHVIHVPHLEQATELYGYKIHPLAAPLSNEAVLDGDRSKFDEFLKARGIKVLIYAGYASNICLLDRDVGPLFLKPLGYHTLLLRDASLAVETSEFPIGMVHEVITTVYDANGGTISVDDFLAAKVE
jgi:nicotinamidase-related amidase